MSYWRFARNNLRLLSFGFFMAALSSVGQTYLVSLFVPDFIASFSLSTEGFGTVYAVATLGSALALPIVGKKIDDWPLKWYTAVVILGLVIATGLIAWASTLPVLVLGLWMARLCGQGLCSHVSGTVMARNFGNERGKALSLSGLGFPFAESILPLTIAFTIAKIGWRGTWLVMGSALTLLFIPMALGLIGKGFKKVKESANLSERGLISLRQWTRGQVLRDYRFYLILPAAILPPFLLTGLFLYQVTIAQSKGWSTEWIAGCFIAFAACRSLGGLAIGPLVDRFGATQLFRFYLIPLFLGVGALSLSSHPWTAIIYLGFSGICVGFGGNLKTALWAELYGTRHLGAIKSLASMTMVFGTACGPLLVGWVVGRADLDTLLYLSLGMIASSAALSAVSIFRYRVGDLGKEAEAA